MMEHIFDATRWVHIVIGFTGLVAFWVPIATRKGGRSHRRFGKVFEWAAYVVAGTALFNALGRLLDAVLRGAEHDANRAAFGFLVFLAYLGIVTLAAVRHAVRSVRAKDLRSLRTPGHVGLAGASILGSALVAGYALLVWSPVSIVLLVLSPAGALQGREMLRQIYRPPPERMAWFYAHMGNMIGAGIAFHTAFLVFGSRRLFDLGLSGPWSFVPWVLPALIGAPASAILERRYRRHFSDLPVADAGSGAAVREAPASDAGARASV